MIVRESMKTLVKILQESNESAFTVGYLESMMVGIIEDLPKAQQKRIISEIESRINVRKGK